VAEERVAEVVGQEEAEEERPEVVVAEEQEVAEAEGREAEDT
jgi:hypothetical protein